MKIKYFCLLLLFSHLIAFNAICSNELKLQKILGKLNAKFEFADMSIDKYDNIYIVAGFRDSIIIDSLTLYTNLFMDITNAKNPRGVFCIKLDSNLNTVFVKKIFETSDLMAYEAPTFDSKNNCVFNLSFKDTLLYNGDTLIASNNVDGLLLKTDENLNPIFQQRFGNYNDDYLSKVTLDEFDNYYLAGTFNTTWTGYSPNYEFAICNDTIYSDSNGMFIAKFDSNFNCVWLRDYQIIGDERIGDFKIWKGSLYANLSVYNGSYNIPFGGLVASYPLGSRGRLFLAKIDSSNGSAKWLRTITSHNPINNLTYLLPLKVVFYDNRIFMNGSIVSNAENSIKFEGSSSNIYSTPILSNSDYFIGSYDTSGNFIWNNISQCYGSERLSSIIIDSFCHFYGTGSFDAKIQYPNDTLYNFANDDAFIVNYDKYGNYISSAKTGGNFVDQASGIVITNSGKKLILGTTSSPTCAFGNTIENFPGDGNYLFLASIDSLQEPFSNQSTQIIKEDIEVFPNPANTTLNIKTNLSKYQLYCYNTLGELVLQANEKQKSISINPLPNGIYQIKIISDKQYLNKKLIIQH